MTAGRDARYPMIAQTLYGLEEILAKELEDLGATEIEQLNRAVLFSGTKETMYKANLHLRTAIRVLVPISDFVARTEEDLYKGISHITWNRFMNVNMTLAVISSVNSEHFNHANYVALKTKDAIVDQFRNKSGKRPSVDKDNPDIEIYVHIHRQEVKVMLNSSGDSLHKRGYRIAQGIAPLNEVLAAGIIYLSGWDRKQTFVDPMCGSGTFLCEALLMARNEAPGKYRKKFGFQGWPDFDKTIWGEVKDDAVMRENESEARIYGYDKDVAALNYAQKNMKVLNAGPAVKLEVRNFFGSEKPEESGHLVMNPPYDERLAVEDAGQFYKDIGDTLKKGWKGFNAFIFTANKDALKKLGLQPSRRFTLFNGPHECKLHKYELYEGSKKPRKTEDNSEQS